MFRLPYKLVAHTRSLALTRAGRPCAGGVASQNSTAEAQAGNVDICGQVTTYTAATGTLNGLLTINGTPLVMAAGTTLTNSVALVAGANLCLTGSVNTGGSLTGGSVVANVTAAVSVCGTVASFTAATASLPGSITIGGQTVPIAVGTTLAGQALATAGANLCVSPPTAGRSVPEHRPRSLPARQALIGHHVPAISPARPFPEVGRRVGGHPCLRALR